MPPVRNFASVKAVKTERTHEENQERAYIAASRRSDRSLEARIESARRASEIHKKRTGRALRVTEQDVINEEMYEEEDEDLPSQYRRLTAHLQTGSMDFNRRYQAYMQSQIGTRMAMASASYDPAFANGGFMQPYPNAPAFSQPYMQMVPTHMISPQIAPQSAQSAQFYRHAPYPTGSHQYSASNHQRSASVALPHDMAGAGYPAAFPSPSLPRQDEQRRMSLPAQPSHVPSPLSTPSVQPQLSRAPSTTHTAVDSPLDSPSAVRNSSTSPTNTAATSSVDTKQFEEQNRPSAFPTPTHPISPGHDLGEMNTSPFSFALPPESQMALGSHVDQSGFPAAMLMAGSELLPQQNFYTYNPNSTPKSKTSQAPTMPLQATLAPNALPLDTATDGPSYQDLSSATTATSDGLTPYTPVYDFSNSALDLTIGEANRPLKSRNDSSQNSDWEDAFFDYGESTYTV